MTEEQRKQSRAICEAATEGPWSASCDDHYDVHVHDGDAVIAQMHGFSDDECLDANAQFVAHARTALPAALDALDEADEEIERLRAALKLAQARAEDALDEAQRKIKWAKEECPNGGNDGYITPRPCQCHLQSVVEDRDQWKARAEALEAERDAANETLRKVEDRLKVILGAKEYVKPGTGIHMTTRIALDYISQWRGAQATMGAGERSGDE